MSLGDALVSFGPSVKEAVDAPRRRLKERSGGWGGVDVVPYVGDAGPREEKGGWSVPFFYVSSSPWNLYDLLLGFLEVRDIPLGPLFLRDLGLGPEGFTAAGGHGRHEGARIDEIMGRHPDLDFVLVGDSGQHDPAIYLEAVRRAVEEDEP